MRAIALLRLALLPTLVVCSTQLHAEPALHAQTQQFDVAGSTTDAIRASLNRNRQHSSSQVQWHFNWQSTPGQCRITDVSTEVTVTAHTPHLQPDPQRPNAVQQQWDGYLLALQAHQEKHIELALEHARQIEQSIATLPPMGSCNQLQQAANATGQRLLNVLSEANREYDKRTQQGALEGASFP